MRGYNLNGYAFLYVSNREGQNLSAGLAPRVSRDVDRGYVSVHLVRTFT